MNVLKLDNLFIGCRYSLLTGISFFFYRNSRFLSSCLLTITGNRLFAARSPQ
jgi:hypothetical protein